MTIGNARRQGGAGLLLLWAGMSILRATAAQVFQIRIFGNTTFDDMLLPFIALPAILLAALGSVGAAYLAAAFFVLDTLNSAFSSPFLPGSVLFHVMLLVVAVQTLQALRSAARRQATTPEGFPPAPPPIPKLWNRINLGAVVVALLVGALSPAATAYHIRDYGNIPIPSLTVALFGIGTLWTVAAIGVVRLARRHPLLIWVGPVAVFFLGFLLLIVTCPGCKWASR